MGTAYLVDEKELAPIVRAYESILPFGIETAPKTVYQVYQSTKKRLSGTPDRYRTTYSNRTHQGATHPMTVPVFLASMTMPQRQIEREFTAQDPSSGGEQNYQELCALVVCRASGPVSRSALRNLQLRETLVFVYRGQTLGPGRWRERRAIELNRNKCWLPNWPIPSPQIGLSHAHSHTPFARYND